MATEKKQKAKDKTDLDLKKVIEEIHKKEGDESLTIGINQGVMKCEVISTRCIALDHALGVGGLPYGRVVEIFGPESSGKTTLALTVVANVQASGGIAAYVDAENALDPDYMAKIGVDLDNLLFSQPDYGEQALRITERLVQSNKVDIIVVDSVAALVPKVELDGEIGDTHMAAQARMMSQTLRKLSGEVRKSKCCLIFINQIREKMNMGGYGGNPETTPGGRALKFYSSVRLDIRRIGSNKEGEKIISNQTRVKVVKNKVAPPFRTALFDIRFGEGICTMGSIIDLGISNKLIKKSGSFLSYGDEKIGNGKASAVAWLKKNQAVALELDSKLREILFSRDKVDEETGEIIEEETEREGEVENTIEEN